MEQNRFTVDLNTSMDGFFPIPKTLSAKAADLLGRFLSKQYEVSSQLHVLDGRLACEASKDIEDACHELLRATFPMPCEGVDTSIGMVDQISLYQSEIEFAINSMFAACVLAVACVPEFLQRVNALRAPRALPLDERDRTDIVDALQARIQSKHTIWNDHAIFALKNQKPVLPPETFGIDRLTAILTKLGASVAP